MVKDAASAGLYTSGNEKMKVQRIQHLTIEGLLSGTQRAQHPDYLPDMNFKKASKEANAQQKQLL